MSEADLEVFWSKIHSAEVELPDEDWEENFAVHTSSHQGRGRRQPLPAVMPLIA